MSIPLIVMEPLVGRITPVIALIVVDLPAPLWPIKPVIAPSFAVNEISFTTVLSPYFLV